MLGRERPEVVPDLIASTGMGRGSLIFTSLAASVLTVCGSTAAGPIIPLDQQRSVATFVNANQCSGDFLEDGEAADDFGPFEASVATEHGCDSGSGFASVEHQSDIDSSSLTVSASAHSEGHGPVQGIIHAFGHSIFAVTFELESVSEFGLGGVLTARASDGPFIVLVGAAVRLTGPGGQVIVDHLVESGPDGELRTLELDETGVLDPGVYTLRATVDTTVDNEVPPSVFADASMNVTFDVTLACPADLDGSGDVGFGDVLAVLSAWGPCKGCPEDLDGNGDVGFSDLLIILSSWGPCP